MPDDRPRCERPIVLTLSLKEAESLNRTIEVALKFGTEGTDILHFGDKRNSRRTQDQLFDAITESDERTGRQNGGEIYGVKAEDRLAAKDAMREQRKLRRAANLPVDRAMSPSNLRLLKSAIESAADMKQRDSMRD